MFDNLGIAIVQAIGFFGVFGFFVYQLLIDGQKPINTKLNKNVNNINKPKFENNKPKKKGIFGRKEEPKEILEKPKKKGIFGRKEEPKEILEKPKKKNWFK